MRTRSTALMLASLVIIGCSSAAADPGRPAGPRATDRPSNAPPASTSTLAPSSAPPSQGPMSTPVPSPAATQDPTPDPAIEPTATPRLTREPTPKPSREPAGESTIVDLRAVDLHLELPVGWLGADADDLDSLDEIPAVAEALDEVEGSVLVFVALDTRGVDGSPIGDNLSVYDLGADVPPVALEVGADVIAASLESVPEVQGQVKVAMVPLPIGQAARLRFTYTAEVELTVEAYAFNARAHLVLAAFTAPASQADTASGVFATIADSFQ